MMCWENSPRFQNRKKIHSGQYSILLRWSQADHTRNLGSPRKVYNKMVMLIETLTGCAILNIDFPYHSVH